MKIKIAFIFTFIFFFSIAQNKTRVEISGQIITKNLDVEGVTIFNKTGGVGTISDLDGRFTINVFLGDVLNISAVQFQKITLSIDEKVMQSRTLTIVLVEQVNKLDEIVILPYGLTGNLNEDIVNTKILTPNYEALYSALINKDKFEFADDYNSIIRNTTLQKGELYNGVDVIGLFGKLTKPLKNRERVAQNNKSKLITKKYSEAYLQGYLTLSDKELKSLLYFIQDNEFDKTLLNDENKFKFLNYMIRQRDIFQKTNNVKN